MALELLCPGPQQLHPLVDGGDGVVEGEDLSGLSLVIGPGHQALSPLLEGEAGGTGQLEQEPMAQCFLQLRGLEAS